MPIHFPAKAAPPLLACLMLCFPVCTGSALGDYYQELTARNPVHYWRLGEQSGRAAADAVGQADGSYRRGVQKGQAGAIARTTDTAVSFNGRRSYVEIPHQADMLLDEGTVQLWFRDTGRVCDAALLSKDSFGYDDGGHLTVHIRNGKLNVRLQSAHETHSLRSAAIEADTWYNAVFTFGDEGMKLYMNGELADSNGYAGGLGPSSGGGGNAEPLVLGADSRLSRNESAGPLVGHFSGLMDEVAIFDHALSAADTASLYRSGVTGMPEPGTLALVGLGGVGLVLRRHRRTRRV